MNPPRERRARYSPHQLRRIEDVVLIAICSVALLTMLTLVGAGFVWAFGSI